MLTRNVPSREQLVDRTAALVPLLRKNAARARENRRPEDESIAALADAGVFRMRVPARYGGYESDTRTLLDVAAELARADGSLSWVVSVYWIPTWMAGLFPEEVQDEVFATPDVRICGTLSPGALATPVDGGITVKGKWGFISGAAHSHWQEIVAIQAGPDGSGLPVVALVPTEQLQIVDDWFTSGLEATGSVSTVADNIFVPQARVLPLPVILEGRRDPGAGPGMHHAPLLPVASASSTGTAVGLAQAAQDAFFERLPERKITYTAYAHQAEAPLTHLQVAGAAMRVDEARFHAERLTALVDGKCADGAPWTVEERARARADMGAALRRAQEAVDIYATASGGSSIYTKVPIQRIQRDMHAAGLHALMHPDTNDELYGRILCGQEPNTLYL